MQSIIDLKPESEFTVAGNWSPHDGPQTEILQRSEFELLFGGARGGGKTESGFAWLCEPEYYEHPLYKALVIRKNADDLSDWIARARVFYRGLGEITGNPPVIKWKTGGFARTGHLKDKDAYNKYLGHEYHKILIEEITQIPTLDDYLKLISTARSTVPGLKPQIMATTNPGGVGHAWVKKRWVKPAKNVTVYDPISGRSRIYIPSRVEDNPTLMENDPSYVLYLDSLPERLRKAWREGDWDAFEGQFFEDFNQEESEVEPFDIPEEWPLYGSIDPGWSSPCSFGLRTKDFEGNIYRILTYYVAGASPQEHAKEIKSIIDNCPYTNGRMPKIIVAGHDAWAKKDRFSIVSHEVTFADVFRQHGLFLQRANTDRHNGWWAMKQLMRDKQYKLFKGMNNSGIDELVNAEGDEKDPEDIKGKGNDPNVSDHWLDEDRYGIMSMVRPRAKKEEPEKKLPFGLKVEEENDVRNIW